MKKLASSFFYVLASYLKRGFIILYFLFSIKAFIVDERPAQINISSFITSAKEIWIGICIYLILIPLLDSIRSNTGRNTASTSGDIKNNTKFIFDERFHQVSSSAIFAILIQSILIGRESALIIFLLTLPCILYILSIHVSTWSGLPAVISTYLFQHVFLCVYVAMECALVFFTDPRDYTFFEIAAIIIVGRIHARMCGEACKVSK